MSDLQGAPPPSAELLRAVGGSGPVATRRPGRDLAIVVTLSLAYAGALLGLAFRSPLRPDLPGQPLAWTVGWALAWALGFVVPLSLALVPPRRQVLPRAGRARLAGAGFAVALVALSLLLAHVVAGQSVIAADRAQLITSVLGCLGIALAVAAAPLATAMIALRGALPVGARSVGAALGAAGGALGGLVLHFHCPWAEPLHVAFGHGGAVAVGALLGALIAPLVVDQ